MSLQRKCKSGKFGLLLVLGWLANRARSVIYGPGDRVPKKAHENRGSSYMPRGNSSVSDTSLSSIADGNRGLNVVMRDRGHQIQHMR